MRCRSPVLIVSLVSLLTPVASSIPGTWGIGQVDSATGCAPIALGGGCVVWAAAVPPPTYTPEVAVGAGRVLHAGYDALADVTLVTAIGAQWGDVLWAVEIAGQGYPTGLTLSSDGTRVYVTLSPPAVAALDGGTGSVLWTTQFDPVYEIHDAEPLPDGVAVLVQRFSRPTIFARLAATNGALAWAAFAGDETASALEVTADGTKIVVSGASVAAFSTATRALLWRAPLAPNGAVSTQTLLVDEARGQVNVLSSAASGRKLSTLDLDDGALLWSTTIASASDASTAALAGDAVVVSRGRGAVAHDAATGALRWDASQPPEAEVGVGACHELSADAARVLVACSLGVKALDAVSGEHLWQRPGGNVGRPRVDPAAPWAFVVQAGQPEHVLALDPAPGLVKRVADGA